MITLIQIFYLLICFGYAFNHTIKVGSGIHTIFSLILSPIIIPIHIGMYIYNLNNK